MITVGVDCPLGWQVPFLDFVATHRTGHVVPPDDLDGRDWRRTLALRTTDLVVWKQIGLKPLSVAADLIAYPAMRCAGFLSTWSARYWTQPHGSTCLTTVPCAVGRITPSTRSSQP